MKGRRGHFFYGVEPLFCNFRGSMAPSPRGVPWRAFFGTFCHFYNYTEHFLLEKLMKSSEIRGLKDFFKIRIDDE